MASVFIRTNCSSDCLHYRFGNAGKMGTFTRPSKAPRIVDFVRYVASARSSTNQSSHPPLRYEDTHVILRSVQFRTQSCFEPTKTSTTRRGPRGTLQLLGTHPGYRHLVLLGRSRT